MSDDPKNERSDADAELEREIRNQRKFTLAEAIGRMAGPGSMKGESPIARQEQAGVEIELWLTRHLADAEGGLHVVLLRGVKESELLLNNFEQPLVALGGYCQRILSSTYLLEELVRQADIEWGRVFGERPYFEQKGTPPDANDPYTVASVRKTLHGLLDELALGEQLGVAPPSVTSQTVSTMINHELLRSEGILIIKPGAPLEAADFEKMAQEIDPYIEETGNLHGLMVDALSFPGWKTFAGLLAHLRFVKDHHQKIQKVAVVSDSSFLAIAPTIASHFVQAELKHFPSAQRDEALQWLRARG